MKYYCPACGKEYSEKEHIWRCSCGAYLSFNSEDVLRKEDIIKDSFSLWRYEKVLPLNLEEVGATFMEGFTPLVKILWNGMDIYFKMDYLMPTGSFKDRGSSIMINFLKKIGIKKIIDDSSGNAGSSIAAYCTAADMYCDIFIPASTSQGKIVQISLYGAKVHKILGSRENVSNEAIKFSETSKDIFYASHNWHPLFIEGTKTIAYEIWEQLGWRVPDNIIAPFGGGSMILCMYKGFKELLKAGEVTKIPKLFPIQAKNCAPLYDLYNGGSGEVKVSDTAAEGIAIANPIRRMEAIEVVRETGSSVEAVTEAEIVQALRDAASLGFYIEPTSATAIAGAKRLIASATILPGEVTVIILSGNGLKSTDKIGKMTGIIKD
jgi:threonine synthase